MFFALALPLLAACANTQEQEFKRNAAEANFKLGVGYMPVSYTQRDVYERQARHSPVGYGATSQPDFDSRSLFLHVR